MLKRLLQFRDLLIIFTWREFIIRYKQSMIGIFWAILQPLSLMLLFTFIFSYILNMEVSGVAYPVFFYAGLLPWTFFSSALNYSIPSLTNHYNLITKIYFPREILPLSGILVAFVDFLIASLFFVLLLFIYKVNISLTALWVIPLFVMLFVFTIAVSLFLSGLNVYYRDVKLATSFLIQLWFFASPVIYSIDRIDMKLKVFLFLNPLTFIIENMRRVILEGRTVVLWQFLLVSLLIMVFYISAYRFFIRIERAFADVI
jgi:ABC-type polysaccharide/polyol phosphate export permease